MNTGRTHDSGEYAEAYLAAKATLENQRKELIEKIKNPGNVRKEILDGLLTDINNELIQLDIRNKTGGAPALHESKKDSIN